MSCAMSAIIALSAMTITAGANESDIFEESTVKESTTGSFENPISWLPEEEISSENSTTDTEIYKIVVPFESKVYFSYSDYYTKGDTSLINVSIYDPNGKKFGVNNLKSLVTMMFTFSKGTYIFEITSNCILCYCILLIYAFIIFS